MYSDDSENTGANEKLISTLTPAIKKPGIQMALQHEEGLSEPGIKSPGRKIAFGWYGGKYSHLNWLLPLLPYTHHYCEPFGGSAAVLLNRRRI
ncbi:MAG: DNA adenine methylase [Methanocella conradii]|nr:DNA adenine methylase [Methanocella conradii]MDI6897675.1 DNA adenine methylase [Methanocella conradii]